MKQKQIIYWLSVAVVGIALGLGLQFVRAWTEPTTAPPGGNVGAPINTSANPQTKAGGLNIGQRLKVGEDISNPPGEAGQIRWTGSDFQGFTGTEWKSLTGATTVIGGYGCTVVGSTYEDSGGTCTLPHPITRECSCPSNCAADCGQGNIRFLPDGTFYTAEVCTCR
jgi:hypothetical protein